MSNATQVQSKTAGQGVATSITPGPTLNDVGRLMDAKKLTKTQKQEDYRKKYRIMHCGVGPHRDALYDSMGQLCERIGCSESELVWHLVQKAVSATKDAKDANAIKAIIGEVATNEHAAAGTAPGWAVIAVPKADGSGASELRIVDCDARYKSKGMAGLRAYMAYDSTDTKARRRAARLAWKEVLSLLSLTGLSRKNITFPDSIKEFVVTEA